jgi:peptidoglycan/LPS O-acetylase OafA/YrhL
MSTATERPLTRVAPLDGLRGIAILAVVLHNTVAAVVPPAPDHLARFLERVAGPGWIGVQLFFALSGCLIAGELLDHQGARNYLRAFYARRALRILPLYYSTLVLLLAITAFHAMPAVAHYLRDDGWQLWLLVNNYAGPPPVGFGHFWSLAVEAQFYAFVPLLVARARAPQLAVICICIALGALATRTAFALAGASGWTIYTDTVFRLDALALGAAGACLIRIEGTRAILRKHSAAAFLLAGGILLLGAHPTHSYDYSRLACQTCGYALAAIACALVVASAGASPGGREAREPWVRWLSSSPLRLVGRYSFGIYIFHNLLNHFVGVPLVRRLFQAPLSGEMMAAYSAVVFTVSFILAALSFEFLERRFLRLKPRYETSPARTAAGLRPAHALSDELEPAMKR